MTKMILYQKSTTLIRQSMQKPFIIWLFATLPLWRTSSALLSSGRTTSLILTDTPNDCLRSSWRYRGSNLFSSIHVVEGITCREVTIQVKGVGPVTILEATAESQEVLVDMALALDEGEVNADQKLKSGDPYGAVLWPAASAVANHLLDFSDRSSSDLPLLGLTVLELGAGTGLVSIAASLGGASSVLATDYEPVPLKLLDYAQTHLNKIVAPIKTELFDICNHSQPLPPADIVVAADIMYEPLTGKAMAKRVWEALQRSSRILVGDSPGRAGRPAFMEELLCLGVTNAQFVDMVGQTCTGPRHELICGKGSKSVSRFPEDLVVAIMDLDPSKT